MHAAWFAFVFVSSLTMGLAGTAQAQQAAEPPPPPPPAALPNASPPPEAVPLAPARVEPPAPPVQPSYQSYDTEPPPSMRLLEDELRELEEQRGELSLAPPIITLAVGGGVLGVGALLLFAGLAQDAVCRSDEDCGNGDGDTLYLIGGIAAAIGGVMAIIGLTTLIGRASERRRLGRRIKEIRRELGPSRGFAMTLGPHPGGLSLQMRF